MAGSIVGIRPTLESLARETWAKIADGRQLGVPMGEVGITDHNMLTLRREHPSLIVHKHSIHEEVRTGADWEWWLDTAEGWLCLVFQAKILDASGRYAGITKRHTVNKLQAEVLLESCLRRSELIGGTVWPFYCLYNSWRGAWPEGVPMFDRLDTRAMSFEELQLFGCAAANAWDVRHVLRDRRYSNRRTLRDSYLPFSRPWSMIFPDPATAAIYDPVQTIKMLSSWIPRRRSQLPAILPTPPEPLSDDGELGPGKSLRRDRAMVYHDPALIQQPPEYIRDLIDGTARTRRIKPLARRVLILP